MYFPNSLQWHLTHTCNLRCSHCYHDTYQDQENLSFDELKTTYDSFISLCKPNSSPSIVLTGGEPFAYKYFFPLLEYIHSTSNHNSITPEIIILTNGILLTEQNLEYISNKFPFIVAMQISIEGDEVANDKIRGKGTFKKILRTLDLFEKYKKIHLNLSMTISKSNTKEIDKLIPLLLSYRISLRIMRNIPLGINKKYVSQILPTAKEMQQLYKHIHSINKNYSLHNYKNPKHPTPIIRTDWCVHGIDHHETYQHQKRCVVLDKKLITIMPNGDVYPCRLLPTKIGNIRETSLNKIYNSKTYNNFTNPQAQDIDCHSCNHFTRCQGGAPCMSNAVYNNPFKKDPHCWR